MAKFLEKHINDFFRDFSSFGSVWFYLLILTTALIFNQKFLLIKLLLGLIITYAVTAIIRIFYFKNRPNKEKHSNFLSKLDASSFPSLHSMRISFLAFILAKFFSNFYLTILFIIIAMLTAYSRIYIKKHYFIDVIIGFILGILIALIIT